MEIFLQYHSLFQSHAAGARSHTEIDMAELQLCMQRVKLFLRGWFHTAQMDTNHTCGNSLIDLLFNGEGNDF